MIIVGNSCGSNAVHIKYCYDIPVAPTIFPLRTKAIADALKAEVSAAAANTAGAEVPKPPLVKEIEAITVSAPPAAPSAGTTDDKKKQGKKEKGAAKTDVPAPAVAVVPAQETHESAPASTAAGVDMSSLDPTRLDIRIGRINKCWNHPDSTKLLCEEVDVGDADGSIRTIASGLREYYSAEEMVGKYVVVLCNLKERAIAGFKSQVMCI